MAIRVFRGKHLAGSAEAEFQIDDIRRTYRLNRRSPAPFDSFEFDAQAGVLDVWTTPDMYFRIVDCHEVFVPDN